LEQFESFCFCSDNKRTKSKRFGFVPIISFNIRIFVLSFRSPFPQQAERKEERILIYLLRTTTLLYRVAADFPEHFRSFTVALKNQFVSKLFCAKLSQLSAEAETKTNRNIPAKMYQQEATRAFIVSRLRAAGVQ
jgi:hypothetical protein